MVFFICFQKNLRASIAYVLHAQSVTMTQQYRMAIEEYTWRIRDYVIFTTRTRARKNRAFSTMTLTSSVSEMPCCSSVLSHYVQRANQTRQRTSIQKIVATVLQAQLREVLPQALRILSPPPQVNMPSRLQAIDWRFPLQYLRHRCQLHWHVSIAMPFSPASAISKTTSTESMSSDSSARCA